jgi:hypothetical protein
MTAATGNTGHGLRQAVAELQRLHPGHAEAVLAFELANRSYFAAFISDRGDEFFDQFTEQHSALLAEQEAGLGAYHGRPLLRGSTPYSRPRSSAPPSAIPSATRQL